MDVNCNDPFLTTLNDSPEQGRVRSVKLSQLLMLMPRTMSLQENHW